MGADGAQVAAVGQPSVEGARDDLPLHRLAQDVQRLPATGLNQIWIHINDKWQRERGREGERENGGGESFPWIVQSKPSWIWCSILTHETDSGIPRRPSIDRFMFDSDPSAPSRRVRSPLTGDPGKDRHGSRWKSRRFLENRSRLGNSCWNNFACLLSLSPPSVPRIQDPWSLILVSKFRFCGNSSGFLHFRLAGNNPDGNGMQRGRWQGHRHPNWLNSIGTGSGGISDAIARDSINSMWHRCNPIRSGDSFARIQGQLPMDPHRRLGRRSIPLRQDRGSGRILREQPQRKQTAGRIHTNNQLGINQESWRRWPTHPQSAGSSESTRILHLTRCGEESGNRNPVPDSESSLGSKGSWRDPAGSEQDRSRIARRISQGSEQPLSSVEEI